MTRATMEQELKEAMQTAAARPDLWILLTANLLSAVMEENTTSATDQDILTLVLSTRAAYTPEDFNQAIKHGLSSIAAFEADKREYFNETPKAQVIQRIEAAISFIREYFLDERRRAE